MKKIAYLSLLVLALLGLTACKNDSLITAKISNVEPAIESVSFDVNVNDPNSEITGDIAVYLVDEDGKDVTSKPLSFENGETSLEKTSVTISDLDPETSYVLVVRATVGRKNVDINTFKFTTFGESEVAITTAEEFLAMKDNKAGNYVLQNDIDFTDIDFVSPFPSGRSFSGSFDGQGFTLSNITIDKSASYVGVFAYVSSGTVKNVVFDNVQIGTAEAPLEISSSSKVGIVSGNASSAYSKFTDITVKNSGIYYKSNASYTSAQFYVGGFVGELRGEATNINVTDVKVNVEVTGASLVKVGGAVAYLYTDATLTKSNSTGDISLVVNGTTFGKDDDSTIDVGGLIGRSDNIYNAAGVNEVYSMVDISATLKYNTLEETENATYSINIGGLIGYASMRISEAFAGGSISVVHSQSEFETAVSEQFNIGGLIGKYFGSSLSNVVRYANLTTIIVTMGENPRLNYSQLLGYDRNKDQHTYGVFGVQTAAINDVEAVLTTPVIDDMTSYFGSEWVQAAYDGIQPLDD